MTPAPWSDPGPAQPAPGHDHPHAHGHAHDDGPGQTAGPLADASVRRARPSDAPAIGVIQAEVFRAAYAGRLPDEVLAHFEPTSFAKSWRSSLEAPPPGAHALFVALAGAQVVGLAAVGPAQDPHAPSARAELTLLGVHPAGRRQGHGSRLLQAAVDHLLALGADSLGVWVLVDDEDTRGFLQGAGLAPDGAHRDRVVSPEGQTLREVRLTCTLEP